MTVDIAPLRSWIGRSDTSGDSVTLRTPVGEQTIEIVGVEYKAIEL